MVSSTALTVEEYLESLPAEKREVVAAVRRLVLQHLPKGYVEEMHWGMISYEIPLDEYPNTYNGQPLGYVAIAAQKNYFSLYLMTVYQDSGFEQELREAFRTAGKKLDMGKSCVRFHKLDDLPVEAIGSIIARVSPPEYIARYEAIRSTLKK